MAGLIDLLSGLLIVVQPKGEQDTPRVSSPAIVCDQCHQRIMDARRGLVVTARFLKDGEPLELTGGHVERPVFVHGACLDAFKEAHPVSDWATWGTVAELQRRLVADFGAVERMQQKASAPKVEKPRKKRRGRPGFNA